MSWSVSLNDLQQMTDGLPDDVLATLSRDNPLYEADAGLAFECARQAGLVSAGLSGGRVPSPYGGPDTVTISIVGFSDERLSHAVPPVYPDAHMPAPQWAGYGESFYETMARTIHAGPDPVRVPDPPGGAGGGDGDPAPELWISGVRSSDAASR